MYQCTTCGKVGTAEEMMGHHHSWDTSSFLVGAIVGFAGGFLLFTTVGKKVMLTGMGLAKREAEGLARQLEAKLPKV